MPSSTSPQPHKTFVEVEAIMPVFEMIFSRISGLCTSLFNFLVQNQQGVVSSRQVNFFSYFELSTGLGTSLFDSHLIIDDSLIMSNLFLMK